MFRNSGLSWSLYLSFSRLAVCFIMSVMYVSVKLSMEPQGNIKIKRISLTWPIMRKISVSWRNGIFSQPVMEKALVMASVEQ